GNVEMNVDIDFNLGFSKDRSLEVIEEISVEESKNNNVHSMVVYFVKPGDTLWRIAKKLKSTMEDILRVNELEDGRVEQGQQLYIPKYIGRGI
ncbi:MAG: LysM peptidoglycan-binding domain-containing protein, partial [Oscillospiraceae bacterium]|nr:LysM peptidoglycan-binding domain-containing protein [Oscillospiraceae bacterium]